MTKLYGEELEKELQKRRVQKDIRRDQRKSFKDRAKELGLSPSEYLDWEQGKDVCPHKKYVKYTSAIHKPLLLVETCADCGDTRIIAKIETDEDFDKYKKELTEALENNKKSCSLKIRG
jgi:hypothetical protein